MKKLRPIDFSERMINQIISGRKTRTRRIVKDIPQNNINEFVSYINKQGNQRFGHLSVRSEVTGNIVEESNIRCKYGEKGDQLFVREPWQALCEFDNLKASEIPKNSDINYPANGDSWLSKLRQHQSMPWWASRIRLDINSVHIERLHDITTTESFYEGVSSIGEFKQLWEELYVPGSWKLNPFVFVIRFTPIYIKR